jgi:hypothetical protein
VLNLFPQFVLIILEERIVGNGVTIENVLLKNGQVELLGSNITKSSQQLKVMLIYYHLGLDWIKSVIR